MLEWSVTWPDASESFERKLELLEKEIDDMEATWEKARELGRLLGQSDEYKALQRAKDRISNEREMVTHLNRLGELEVDIARASARRGAAASDC